MSAVAKRTISLALVAVLAFIAGVYFVTAGSNLFGNGDFFASGKAESATAVRVPTPLASVLEVENTFTAVAEAVNPTVVQIRSSKRVRQPQMREFFDLWDFFGQPNPRGRDDQPDNRQDNGWNEFFQPGLGSGVLIRADGHIITNNHVVDGADELEVVFIDGQRYPAKLVGTDPLSDIAVIKVDAPVDLPFIALSDPQDVRVGQWVLAFGSPLSADLSNTVTAGIISALGRSVALPAGNSQQQILGNLIQTDAAINPGNSGGPLVNLRGELVGINNAIISRSGGNQGIGFSIPVSTVSNVVEQLIEKGKVSRGYLGVTFRPVTEALAGALSISQYAAQIATVVEGEAADNAGLKAGDIIVAINGKELRMPDQLRTIIANSMAGDRVEVEYLRDDERRKVTVKLGEYPNDLLGAETSPTGQTERLNLEEELGFSMQGVTPELARRYSVPNGTQGVIVTGISRTSNAYREAELREGDVITEVNRRPVKTPDEFKAAYEEVDPGSVFLVRVLRGEAQFRTALTRPE